MTGWAAMNDFRDRFWRWRLFRAIGTGVASALGLALAAQLFTAQPAAAQFTQQGPKLVGTGATGTDVEQGYSVSLSQDGNIAIVGGDDDDDGQGAAWIFSRTAGVWSQQGGKLVGTGGTGSNGASQGYAVALSADGSTAIVGGLGDGNKVGAAWIFVNSGGVWTQQGDKLVGNGATGTSYQGSSVALSADGNTAVVGGDGDNSNAGAAWVFTRDSFGVWSQQGPKLVGAGAVGNAEQGTSVSISADGNTVLVGGPIDNATVDGLGAVWIFTRDGLGNWSQQGSKLVGTGNVGDSKQGFFAALSGDGNTAIVGGYRDDSNTGAAWIFTRSAGAWSQQGDKLVGTGAVGSAEQGVSVSLSADGDTAIVGGNVDNGRIGNSVGAAWIFTRSRGVWTQLGDKLVGTGIEAGSYGVSQGYAVALSADASTAIVGGLADNNLLGAAWVFARPADYVGTSTALVSSANPSLIGEPVEFTATVTATTGTPTGMVTFKDGADTLGTGTLSSGVAVYSTSALTHGDHIITAVYNGSGNFTGSTSDPLTQVVGPSPVGPIATAATDVTASGFTANWNASLAAVGYQLDIATDAAFTSFVPGYQARNVGNVTSADVTGLAKETDYHYRVRAVESSLSASSNTIDVTTTAIGPLELLGLSLLAFVGMGLRYRFA